VTDVTVRGGQEQGYCGNVFYKSGITPVSQNSTTYCLRLRGFFLILPKELLPARPWTKKI